MTRSCSTLQVIDLEEDLKQKRKEWKQRKRELWDTELFGEDLHERAARRLGYTHLKQVLQQEPRSHSIVPRVFKELGISPYTPESIKEYIEKTRRKESSLLRRLNWGEVRLSLYTLLICATCIAIYLYGAMCASTPLMYVGAIGFFVSAVCFIKREREPLLRMPCRWYEYPISGYPFPIPDFALYKALALEECLSGYLRFTILSLEREVVQKRKVLDPILVMYYEGKSYYLAVWDEPSFTGVREDEL